MEREGYPNAGDVKINNPETSPVTESEGFKLFFSSLKEPKVAEYFQGLSPKDKTHIEESLADLGGYRWVDVFGSVRPENLAECEALVKEFTTTHDREARKLAMKKIGEIFGL